MHPALNLDLPEPEWIGLLRAEHAKGKSVSQIAREIGLARPSVSMLLSGTYPARSLDLVTAKHGRRVVEIYRDQVLCPHLRKAIGKPDCRTHASAPMSMSNPDRLAQWAACDRCPLNPLKQEDSNGTV